MIDRGRSPSKLKKIDPNNPALGNILILKRLLAISDIYVILKVKSQAQYQMRKNLPPADLVAVLVEPLEVRQHHPTGQRHQRQQQTHLGKESIYLNLNLIF